MTDKPRLPEDEKQKEKKKKFYLTIFIVLLLLASFYLFWSALTTNPEEKVKESQPTPTTETTSQEAQKQEEEYTIYKVQSGDTLFSIAKKFNVKMDDIIKLNNLEDPNKLQVGQELKIPAVPTTQPTAQKNLTSQEQP